jgi:hypothetical protein
MEYEKAIKQYEQELIAQGLDEGTVIAKLKEYKGMLQMNKGDLINEINALKEENKRAVGATTELVDLLSTMVRGE